MLKYNNNIEHGKREITFDLRSRYNTSMIHDLIDRIDGVHKLNWDTDSASGICINEESANTLFDVCKDDNCECFIVGKQEMICDGVPITQIFLKLSN